MAERIGLEPMDRYSRSRISNPLHYHSANAPNVLVLYIKHFSIASMKSKKRHNLYFITVIDIKIFCITVLFTKKSNNVLQNNYNCIVVCKDI